ncbi:hypothetical protein ACFW04_010621 [Cataglyphis niger]
MFLMLLRREVTPFCASCLQKVSLEVVPEVVQRGQEAILRCHYDLQKAPLYSLKWYRGRHEFYRFSPSEDPPIKIFNISGIYVDSDNSNQSQVTLRKVDFGLSGTFSCEVTADAPTFSTASGTKNLTVVSIPSGRPVIVSERERYDIGDVLRANCSLPSSKPPVHFLFTLNNMPTSNRGRLFFFFFFCPFNSSILLTLHYSIGIRFSHTFFSLEMDLFIKIVKSKTICFLPPHETHVQRICTVLTTTRKCLEKLNLVRNNSDIL